MKAMILAAGLGTRMRPLTNTIPKPLLEVAGKALIEYHIQALAAAGIKELVINVSYLHEKIIERLGDGSQWGVNITYSIEQPEPLETAGGIRHAEFLLGNQPFILVNGDVWCDYDFAQLKTCQLSQPDTLAHLVLVPNPVQNPDGDFALIENGGVKRLANKSAAETSFTFSGISLINPKLVMNNDEAKLGNLLRAAADLNLIDASLHSGIWEDIGTPQRLNEIRRIKGTEGFKNDQFAQN